MSYVRLHVTTEGQTEQVFVRRVLASHLYPKNIAADARCVLTSKDKKRHKAFRGGLLDYARAKKDIETWLKEDRGSQVRFTTMFDLYGLPPDFPRFAEARNCSDPYQKVSMLEEGLESDIRDHRFIPYIQLHEFEALLFTEISRLGSEYLDHDRQINRLASIPAGFDDNPELIDDSPNTAPSKRILAEIPDYHKNQHRPKCRRHDRSGPDTQKLPPLRRVAATPGSPFIDNPHSRAVTGPAGLR